MLSEGNSSCSVPVLKFSNSLDIPVNESKHTKLFASVAGEMNMRVSARQAGVQPALTAVSEDRFRWSFRGNAEMRSTIETKFKMWFLKSHSKPYQG